MFEVVEERCQERVEECGSENLEVAGVDAAVIGGAGDGVGGRCQVDVHHGIRGINVAVMKLAGGLVLNLYGKILKLDMAKVKHTFA